jgi:hypothetical protein
MLPTPVISLWIYEVCAMYCSVYEGNDLPYFVSYYTFALILMLPALNILDNNVYIIWVVPAGHQLSTKHHLLVKMQQYLSQMTAYEIHVQGSYSVGMHLTTTTPTTSI